MIRARLAMAFLGIVLAIVAIARDDKRIAWVAMVALATALILGMIIRRRVRRAREDDPLEG